MIPTEDELITFYSKESKNLAKYATRWVSFSDAQEIVNEVFLSLIKNSKDMNDMHKYIFSSVRNRCLMQFRQGKENLPLFTNATINSCESTIEQKLLAEKVLKKARRICGDWEYQSLIEWMNKPPSLKLVPDKLSNSKAAAVSKVIKRLRAIMV